MSSGMRAGQRQFCTLMYYYDGYGTKLGGRVLWKTDKMVKEKGIL